MTGDSNQTRKGDCKMEIQKKKKIVVVMGATGAGKSKLAIDIATFINGTNDKVPFPRFEIVNADSMQVYRGLDVLTNKVNLCDRKGVPHHMMGTIDPSVEFTSKLFRDLAIPIIDDILARGCVPIIVGGTNFYIQALVSPFLIDDVVVDLEEYILADNSREEDSMPRCMPDQINQNSNNLSNDYNHLKEIDPIAANRIHPNDSRKVKRYLSLYSTSGILPSKLFQGKTSVKWGQPDRFRYDCCFVLIDASLPAIDKYVDDRVDSMIEAGLLDEVFTIYQPTADYTRGLRQAIGVREFEIFFSNCLVNNESIENNGKNFNVECRSALVTDIRKFLKGNLSDVLDLVDEKQRTLLNESINNLKTNTRRLVRRQKRRFNKLRTLFGWELHCFDSTEALRGSENYWQKEVVEPCICLVKTFLCDTSSVKLPKLDDYSNKLESRDLWTQHVCKPCGDRIFRGAHEWEQHQTGRNHRKRVSAFRKRSLMTSSSWDMHRWGGRT